MQVEWVPDMCCDIEDGGHVSKCMERVQDGHAKDRAVRCERE